MENFRETFKTKRNVVKRGDYNLKRKNQIFFCFEWNSDKSVGSSTNDLKKSQMHLNKPQNGRFIIGFFSLVIVKTKQKSLNLFSA